MSHNALTTVCLAAAFLACVPADDGTVEHTAAVTAAVLDQAGFRATIDAMREEFVQAAASGDWQEAASILDPEVIMVAPGGGDWAAIKAASDLPYPSGTEMNINPIEVRQLSSDWGYEFGTTVITWTPAGAAGSTTLSDTYLLLFRRTGDGWKLYREVASANSLPPVRRP